jgi:hypothetical protein
MPNLTCRHCGLTRNVPDPPSTDAVCERCLQRSCGALIVPLEILELERFGAPPRLYRRLRQAIAAAHIAPHNWLEPPSRS